MPLVELCTTGYMTRKAKVGNAALLVPFQSLTPNCRNSPPSSAACDRGWLAATGLTVLADILLRKPLSVLVVAAFYTIRDNVRVPETVYVGNGRSKRPIGSI